MYKTDKEVLELCKVWFEDIMERCDRLTSGNVSHDSRTIYGIAKNSAEYIDEHLHSWKPSDEQMKGIECTIKTLKYQLNTGDNRLDSLYNDLKKLRGE